MTTPACSFPGCSTRVLARGWCAAHYHQWRTGGALKSKRRSPGMGPAPKPPKPVKRPKAATAKEFKSTATVVWGDVQMEEMMSHAPTFKGRK